MSNNFIQSARSALNDFVGDSRFALFDVAPIDSLLAFPIFIPLLTGFSTVSAPELTIEAMEITEGNATFHRHVLKSASVGSMTFTRGVRFYDADFWRWTLAAAKGDTGSTSAGGDTGGMGRVGEVGGVTYRRSLLLVHFFRNFGIGYGGNVGARQGEEFGQTDPSTLVFNTGAAVAGGAAISLATGQLDSTSAGLATAAQFAALDLWGGISGASSVQVPARAFLLKGCIPTRYKTGSDFDANSGQISVQELEIAVESFEEISLAAT